MPIQAQGRRWKGTVPNPGNVARLNEDVIGMHFAFHVATVRVRFTGHVFVAAAPLGWLHVLHPEVTREVADDIDGLLEGVLDIEAHAVDPDDLNRIESRVGAHQQATSSCWVNDCHKAHEAP